MTDKKLCDYGCGDEAIFQIKNGKWCCCKSPNQCSENRRKNQEKVKLAYTEGRLNAKINYETLSDEAKENMKWNKGKTILPQEMVLIKGRRKKPVNVKNFILLNKIKRYECEICKITNWLNKEICLELHHIDGDKTNNTLENLQLLCPNCHSQTNNHRGKNINSGVKKVSDEELVEAIKTENTISNALIKVGLNGSGGNYNRAYTLIMDNDIKLKGKRYRKDVLDEELINALKSEVNIETALKKVDLRLHSGNYKRAINIIEKYNINIDKLQYIEEHNTNRKSGLQIKREEINIERIEKIKNSNIIFSELGWVTKVSELINLRPQKICGWMKKHMPDFYGQNCFKRCSNEEYIKKEQEYKQQVIGNQQEHSKWIEERKEIILNSGIDFKKFGWITKLSILLNITNGCVLRFMERHMTEFYDKECYRKVKNNI